MGHDVFDDHESPLALDGVPLERIAREVPTPFYVYGLRALVDRFSELDRAFGSRAMHAVALKANAQPALLRPLVALGAGAEVVSGAELALALALEVPPERVVFSGVGKTDSELESAVEAGIGLVVVESEEELEVLDAIADRAGRTARAALRLNPDIDARTHRHIATGVSTAKFGLDPETARSLFRRREIYRHVELSGVHSHIGSQITSPEPLEANARMLARWVQDLASEGVDLEILDLGGGLGITYDLEPAPSFARYAESVLPALEGLDVRILTEPGRALFGPVGALVVRVLYVKSVHGRSVAVVDAGLNDFLRPALYDAYHRIVPVRRRDGSEQAIDVAGAVCESSDVFARARKLPPLRRGDLLAILDAGAYGFVMSSNYNLRPRPGEVVVDSGSFRVVRSKETDRELVARELEGGA